MYQKKKGKRGITLISLVITVIVLLILAGVAIGNVQGDGIISKAKEARDETVIAQEKEELQLQVVEWELTSKNGSPTLSSFLSEKYRDENVQLNTDESITVTMESGNRYKVTESGETILLDGTVEEPEPIVISITLDKTSITKEIDSGEAGTETLTATLNNASGELTWTSSDESVAEISGEGNTRTIILKKAGAATISVSYGDINAICNVTVTEAISITLDKTSMTKEIEIGGTGTETLTATSNNASGELTWTSSDESVAEISGEGNTRTITLKKAGTATITVSYGSVNATCNVTVTETPISTTKSRIGQYADIDGNGTVDGVIYADLAFEVSDQWTDSNGTYSYSAKSNLKNYYIRNTKHTDSFGTKDVITAIEGTTGEDRFYVMALDDFNAVTTYCWYYGAFHMTASYDIRTSEDFGTGKANTATMISKWNSSEYGTQNAGGTDLDIWGVIQSEVSNGWFVPSRGEWSAFGNNLGITSSNYTNYNLYDLYWSSSNKRW